MAWEMETHRSTAGGQGVDHFNFNNCLQSYYQSYAKLDMEYSSYMKLKDGNSNSLTWSTSIVNFGQAHPLDLMTSEGSLANLPELGRIENFVMDLCRDIHTGQVRSNPNSSGIATDLSFQLDVFKKEPIAIVGLSFRLPGGNNADEFWKMLIDGKEGIKPVPPHRWNAEHTLLPCRDKSVEAGFLDVPVDQFDPEFFGISEKEAELLDPQSRLLHEVAWEALEDAMIDPDSLRGTPVGVFVGSWLQDYRQMLSQSDADTDFLEAYKGSSIAGGCGGLSKLLGVKGPSLGTESGCSSAIVAVDMACKSLKNREANLALACGVNLLLHPFGYHGLSFILSPEGRCKTFDESANGFARAEACAVLLLKRFADATRDGDNIWGLIRGYGVTQEGVSKSFGTPTIHCESLAMEMALKDAGVDPVDVSYIEAHGTGTPVGDPLEIAAITKAYASPKERKEPLVIGSVKTNVGHTESVSGITGIIKVLLSMKNETIPKHINLEKLNPAIKLENIPARIPLESIAWPRHLEKGPRIAGVSSFGISGTDGHVIIQEPPAPSQAKILYDGQVERPVHIMKISAKSPESFQELLNSYENLLNLKSDVNSFADIAYSTNTGRTTFNHRAVIIAKDSGEAIQVLRNKSFKYSEVNSNDGKLCFVFNGQTSTHQSMFGAKLCGSSPIFREEFEKCGKIFLEEYGINLKKLISGNEDKSNNFLERQTATFCIEYCLIKLWESWGVTPDYVIGHGFGEYAAAVAAGLLDFEDALKLVVERSKFIQSIPRGKMLMVQADKLKVDETLKKFKKDHRHFWIGYVAINSPTQVVLSGDAVTIGDFANYCRGKSLKTTTLLGEGQAANSLIMKPLLADFIKAAKSAKTPKATTKECPKFISGLEGKLIDPERIDANYWIRQVMEPVLFMDACKALEAEGCSIFLEVGTSPVLGALIIENFGGQSVTCLPSIKGPKADEWVTLLNCLGQLFLSEWKGSIDWKGFDRFYLRARVPLPFYPFNRRPIWKELETSLPVIHPLLGNYVATASSSTIFENRLTLKKAPFVLDHVIGNTVIFPGAGFLEMCLAGGAALLHDSLSSSPFRKLGKPQHPISVRSLRITSPLALYEGGVCRLQTVVKQDTQGDQQQSYSIGVHRYVSSSSGGLGEWVSHATAKILPAQDTITPTKGTDIDIDIPSIQSSWERTDNTEFYEKLPEVGLRFGPKFRSLETGWRSDHAMLASVKVPNDDIDDGYLIHPVVVDAMIQATMIWTSRDKLKLKLQVPVQIEEFKWLQSSPNPSRYIYCTTNEKGQTTSILLDGEGTHLAQMTGVDFIETTVKLVEGMIQQQGTAMPKLWGEAWKTTPGPLQCRFDLVTAKQVLSKLDKGEVADKHGELLDQVNDVGNVERSFYANICNLTRLFFMSALYELGWKPRKGTRFSLDAILQLLPKPKEHVRRYCRYFLHQLAEAGSFGVRVDSEKDESFQFYANPPTQDELDKGLRTVSGPDDKSRTDYRIVCEIGRNLSKVLTDKIQALDLLFPEDPSRVSAHQFYLCLSKWVHPAVEPANDKWVIPLLTEAQNVYMQQPKAAANPPILRVLEVGAGTGGFTKGFVEYLYNRVGSQFEIYFTDISPSFFNAAEKELEKYSKQIIFKKFTMEEDPLAQGLCPGYFDLIIACEVLHVAKDIRKTLRNLKCLLKPGGIFQIIETTQPDPKITLVFGLLEGYWQFEDLDFRPHHTTLTPEKWVEALKGINCDQVVITPAYNNVHSFISAITSSDGECGGDHDVTSLAGLRPPQYSWLVFSHEGTAHLAETLKRKITGANRTVRVVQRPPICLETDMKGLMKAELQLALEGVERVEGIIYMWGLPNMDGVKDRDRDQSNVSLPFLNLIQEITELKAPPRVYVVTQGIANVEGSEILYPTPGTLNGLIRSVGNENIALSLTLFDLSPDEAIDNQADEIFYNLWGTDAPNKLLAVRENNRLGMKIVSTKIQNNEPLPLPGGCDRFQLIHPPSRLISDLEFGPLENYTLGEFEIEVKVKAVALNFRDLLTVLKPIKEFESFHAVGLDIAGVVTRVGDKVTKRKVGDRVIGMNMDRNLALPSHIKVEEGYVDNLPMEMTFVEGATLPAVFSTAVHCLVNTAGMKKGDKVLIHTASGGVGLCAIQLAKQVGAEIFATAGSKRKQNYLRNLGVKHIFHSRTTHFGKEILEVTNGRGVDIVLNSITGEGFKEASLSALAKNGRFIEMSKLNVWTAEVVKALRPDVFYRIVDLTTLEKLEIERLTGTLAEYLKRGAIRPIAYERFDAVNIRGALNHLQKAKHIGKIVLVMPEFKVENSKITATTPLFNEVSTYLVTGGLGGIGLEVVKWMLKGGAKHVAIASRSPPKPEIARQIEAWNKAGKHVQAFQVDIGNYDQCRELFNGLKSDKNLGFPQLRGVMHAAGVLSDATVENQTWGSFSHCYNPKVNGTWNLHDLTKGLLLEHFVIFSSAAASMGAPGQSNHAASNSFEDTLAAYRRSNGLPATSANWGNWGEVGVATEIDFPGVRPIATSQGIFALETFLKTQTSHLTVINIDSFALACKLFPSLKTNVDDRLLLGDLKSTVIINSDEFWAEVDSAEGRKGKVDVFKNFIKNVLRNILKMDQDEEISDGAEFQTLGIDSLMMLEMKNGLQNILGSRMSLSASQLKDCNNTEVLSNRLVDILQGEEDHSEIQLPTMEELRALIREDSILPEHIRPCEGMLPVKNISSSECVLLTGATGVLGPYQLRELTGRPSIKKIYCLIRKAGNISIRERLLKRLQVIGLDNKIDMTNVECIEGDITDDKFGLSEEDYNCLSANVDVVINSAVRSDHMEKYYKAPTKKQNIRNVNGKGTIRLLEFAVHSKLKHFYHASTLLCVTEIDKDSCLSEDWQDVGAFDQLEFNVGYPISKHISEQLVKQAVERGIPCKSFRFPAIGGDSRNGRCDYITNHIILRWLAYLKLKCMPDVPTPMVVMPVDVCARLSLDVFFNLGAANEVYNIVNAEGLDQNLIGIAKELGIIIQPVSFSEFVEKLKLEEDDSPLGPFKKMYEEEGAAVVEHLQGNEVIMNALRTCAENHSRFFKSHKVPQLVADYDKLGLDSTEEVMRRDIKFLKESGVFKLFGIK